MRPVRLLDEQPLDADPQASAARLGDSTAENIRLQDRLRAAADVARVAQLSTALRDEIAQLQSSNQNARHKMDEYRRSLQELGRAQQELERIQRRPKDSV